MATGQVPEDRKRVNFMDNANKIEKTGKSVEKALAKQNELIDGLGEELQILVKAIDPILEYPPDLEPKPMTTTPAVPETGKIVDKIADLNERIQHLIDKTSAVRVRVQL